MCAWEWVFYLYMNVVYNSPENISNIRCLIVLRILVILGFAWGLEDGNELWNEFKGEFGN